MSAGQILEGADKVLIVNPFMNFGSNLITANLVGRWAGTDGSGTTLTDSVAGRNGTLTNGPTWAAGPVAGTGAVVFDGVNDYVTIATATALLPYPFTVCFFVKGPTQIGWAQTIGKYNAGSTQGYQLYYRPDTTYNFVYIKNGSDLINYGVPSPTGVFDSAWHHLAFTVDSSGIKYYKDGAYVGGKAWTGTPGAPANTVPMELGYSNTTYPFTGSIADTRIYSAALSAADIALIAAGNG